MKLAAAFMATLALALLSLLTPWASLAELAGSDAALARTVLVELRLPRTLIALAYGAALGASGAAIQALFANPLASPDLTGASGGAALGAVVTAYFIALTSPLALALGAVAGAAGALILLLALAGRGAGTAGLLLAGLAISALTGAATSLALALAPSPFAFYDAYDWLMGSLVDRSLPQAALAVAAACVALVVFGRDAAAFDALALGEEAAEAAGWRLRALRLRTVATTALVIGCCVAVAGAIGFIGLMAPVLARPLVGHRPGRAILPAALIGAALLTLADLLVRLAPTGRPIPVGVITVVAGAPFFLWLVTRLRTEGRT